MMFLFMFLLTRGYVRVCEMVGMDVGKPRIGTNRLTGWTGPATEMFVAAQG